MLCWTWSKKGEKMERSKRIRENIEKEVESKIEDKVEDKVEKETVFISASKREENSARIAARPLLTNRKINPFFKNTYINDITVENNFLRPQKK